MSIKVAINGFGRVGRYLIRACLGYEELDIIAVNSRAKLDVLAHLLKYDSVHGTLQCAVGTYQEGLIVNGRKIKVTNVTSNLAELPWSDMGVDIVIEATGKFRKKDELTGHIAAGAKKVIMASPGKGIDGTFVMGVNEDQYDPQTQHIISNASCTTNCLAPVVKVLNDHFKVVRGLMTTIHSYTMDQRLLDGSHKDLRRSRAAALSIIPTTTGAAKAVAEVIPELKNKLDGIALRVPTPNVSVTDLAVEVARPVTTQEVNAILKSEAEDRLKGIIQFCEEELVSVDFTSSPYSAIVDAPLTHVIGKTFVKIFAWYDNESGYSCRLRDLAIHIGNKL
jgi:glyceraldehyde 3-phosphate dehydrogenase